MMQQHVASGWLPRDQTFDPVAGSEQNVPGQMGSDSGLSHKNVPEREPFVAEEFSPE